MKGSVKWQVQTIWRESGINRIGESRHAAKDAARESGARTSAQVAEKTGIHSFRTGEAYQKVWRQCLEHAKAEFKTHDITRLTGEHVSSFLRLRIAEDVGRQTYGQAAAALGKLENALNAYAAAKGIEQSYDFRSTLQELRSEASGLRTMEGGRAFRDPERVIAGLRNPDYLLAAAIQRESGCRVSEATHIRASQLREDGKIDIHGKGGKERTIRVSDETFRRLAERIAENGEFRVSRDAFRVAVSRAAAAANDPGNSHQFRHRWVQDTFQAKLEAWMSREKALAEVSREIGHERADITLHYLGSR